MGHEIEVNIRGIFGENFFKESFFLDLKTETSLNEVFRLIDKKLKTKLFGKLKGQFPDGWVILLNGERISPARDDTVVLKHENQLSVLSALGGG